MTDPPPNAPPSAIGFEIVEPSPSAGDAEMMLFVLNDPEPDSHGRRAASMPAAYGFGSRHQS